MKWAFIILTTLITMTSCSQSENISFCEGIDTKGIGVKCGKKFTTGDISTVINSKNNFNTDQITLKILDITSKDRNQIKNIKINVKKEAKRTNINLPFYNPGKYKIEAYSNAELMASGTVEIAEGY